MVSELRNYLAAQSDNILQQYQYNPESTREDTLITLKAFAIWYAKSSIYYIYYIYYILTPFCSLCIIYFSLQGLKTNFRIIMINV